MNENEKTLRKEMFQIIVDFISFTDAVKPLLVSLPEDENKAKVLRLHNLLRDKLLEDLKINAENEFLEGRTYESKSKQTTGPEIARSRS